MFSNARFGRDTVASIFRTIYIFFFNKEEFSKKIMGKNWREITRPTVFLAFLITASFAITSTGTYSNSELWSNSLAQMSDSEIFSTMKALDIWITRKDMEMEGRAPGSSPASKKIMAKIGSIKADKFAEALNQAGYPDLGYRVAALSANSSRKNSFFDSAEKLIFPLTIILQAKILQLIVKNNVTTHEGYVRTLIYPTGIWLLISSLIEVVIWRLTYDASICMMIITIASLFMVVRQYQILNHSYGISVWKFVVWGIVVAMAIFILSYPYSIIVVIIGDIILGNGI